MPEAVANGLTIHYDTFGDPRDPPVLMVIGLGMQMIGWRTELCQALAHRGLYVVRFDNRDIGLSTKLFGAPVPSLPRTVLLRRLGLLSLGIGRSAYLLSDMAADTVGLMDALGIESAHLVGMSMGGMIAQTVAIEHPHRARSLVSIMSTTGNPKLAAARREARQALFAPLPKTRDEAIENGARALKVIGSPAYYDLDVARARAAKAYDRSPYRLGVARQLDAVLCSPPRDRALARLSIPVSVIHGRLDPLIPVENGLATANIIPGARLYVRDDMGHDLPAPLYPFFVETITGTIDRARSPRRDPAS